MPGRISPTPMGPFVAPTKLPDPVPDPRADLIGISSIPRLVALSQQTRMLVDQDQDQHTA